MGNNQGNRAPVIGYKDTYVDFDKQMYAEGEFRRVYRGTFHGDDRVNGKRCVVKVNKEPYSIELSEYVWKADRRAYQKADEMAKLFNAKYQTSKPIEFIKPEFTSIDPSVASDFLGFKPYGPSRNMPKQVTVAVERYLEGKYEKFVSNVGKMSPKDMATPAAFCHFTYDESNGQVLVCDLQGVRTNSAYKLTDPSVHNGTPNLQIYGPSDLGKCGIVKFFGSHVCNALCEGLKEPQVVSCKSGEEMEIKKIASQISTSGQATDMPTITMPKCGVPQKKMEEMQKNVQIDAVVCRFTH